MFVIFLTLLWVMTLPACDGRAAKETVKPVAVPDAIEEVRTRVLDLAQNLATDLSPTWADIHQAMMLSGEGRSFADYEKLLTPLIQYREKSGARYVYALYPEPPADPAAPIANFLLTVDGSVEPDDWLTPYEAETPLKEAWNGTPTAAYYAWGDGENGEDPCWSAFARVCDSDGNPVALIGVDLPVPEVNDFPAWNRDKAEWNGVTE